MARVLILGATSAVAAACARLYARRGDALHLVGRSPLKLEELVQGLRSEFPATVTSSEADFLQEGQAASVIADAHDRLGGLDVVQVAHGYLGDQLQSEASYTEAELILRTNFLSVVALLIPLANRMEVAGAGKIGVITSVAGERGRPRNFTYGAAKGGLSIYLQGLRSRLVPAGVSVTTLKLGPVDTPMTTDHPKNALFSTPDKVAKRIVAAVDAGQGEVFVPGFWRPIMAVVKGAPESLFQRVRSLSGR